MSRVPTVTDWKATVYQAKGIGNGTRVLLLYLADNMRSDRTVSVPRTRIAQALGVHPSRVTERVREAHEAGLLDTVVAARPRVTAVYAAMFPNPRGADVRTSESESRGAKKRTSQTGFRGADGGSPISKQVEPEALGRKSPRGDEERCTTNASVGPATDEESASECGRTLRVCRETSGDAVARETPTPVDTSPPARRSEATPGGSRETAKRRPILDEIQNCARGDTYVSDDLVALLNDYEDGLGDWAADLWTFKREVAADRREAGRQLNMLANTYRSAA